MNKKHNYKVGDKVRYINKAWRTLPVGCTGTIVRKTYGGYRVKWDAYKFPSGKDSNECLTNSLELIPQLKPNTQLAFSFMTE